MGLMLSILVVCVGVIEALSCYEHFQNGVVHCATNVYENVRRRSSMFLKYNPVKLKLLSENSVNEYGEEPKDTFKGIELVQDLSHNSHHSTSELNGFKSEKKPNFIKSSAEKTKKLDKKEKIQIVKTFLEKPERPRTTRSVSLPELIYSEQDIELTQIINNLVSEPIEEINIEIEDINTEILIKEFEKLYNEYENSFSDKKESSLDRLEEDGSKSGSVFKPFTKRNVSESDAVKSNLVSHNLFRDPLRKTANRKSLFQTVGKSSCLNRSVSVNFDEIESVKFSKPTTKYLNISSYFTKLSNDAPPSDSFPSKLNLVESASYNKLNDTIFEDEIPPIEVIDKTFEEIYNDICDESSNKIDEYEEIEKNIWGNVGGEDGINIKEEPLKVQSSTTVSDAQNLKLENEISAITSSLKSEATDNSEFLRVVEQLAELIVNESLNLSKSKNLILESFNRSEKHSSKNGLAPDALMKHKSKENYYPVCIGQKIFDVENVTQNKCLSNKVNQGVRELSNDFFKENLTDSFFTIEEENLTDSSHSFSKTKSQKIQCPALCSELANLPDDSKRKPSCFKTEASTPPFVISADEKGEHRAEEIMLEECNSFDACAEFLPHSTFQPLIMSVSKIVDIFDVFSESEATEMGSGMKQELLLQYKNCPIVRLPERVENENCSLFEKNIESDNSGQKVQNLDQNQPPAAKLKGTTYGSNAEIQSELDSTSICANADHLRESAEEPFGFQAEILLALEYKEGIKSEGNKNETSLTVLQDTDSKKELRLDYATGCTIRPNESVFELHQKNEESGKSEEIKDIGTVAANFRESHSDYFESLHIEPDKFTLDSKNNKEKNSSVVENLIASDIDKKSQIKNSTPEAFWLIFSGEYTKAMSKDWHSGHFSCWQCDEALTGQRYVLRDDHPYCIKCYESVFANVCEECNKIIGIDSKDLSYKDKHWHEACFLCNKCRVSLVDKQFGSKADKIYCGNCYDAQFASRCDGCGEIFRAGTKKMEYKTRQWHEKCFCCCVCKTPIGTKSFIPREQEIYCATCYEEKFATRCVKCNKIITSGGVTYKNEPWHRECFTCTNCNTSLAGQRFTSRDEKPYCADCFGELFAKRCTACSRPITGIGGTRFISFEDRHWHNDCFICASCKTSLVGRGFITDGDDIICPECAKQKLM